MSRALTGRSSRRIPISRSAVSAILPMGTVTSGYSNKPWVYRQSSGLAQLSSLTLWAMLPVAKRVGRTKLQVRTGWHLWLRGARRARKYSFRPFQQLRPWCNTAGSLHMPWLRSGWPRAGYGDCPRPPWIVKIRQWQA